MTSTQGGGIRLISRRSSRGHGYSRGASLARVGHETTLSQVCKTLYRAESREKGLFTTIMEASADVTMAMERD